MVTPEQELRATVRAMMLTAKAKRGKVTVDEWAAIRLMHLLPEIYQVPHKADSGELTWTTEPAPCRA
jgi:hypothetical protein